MDAVIQSFFTLLVLVMLQAVLGFDNLLYISLESKRVPKEQQRRVRIWGIGLAIVFRIVLLFTLLAMMDSFQSTWFTIDTNALHMKMNFTAAITIFGGAFIVHTAVKEVFHMMLLEEAHENEEKTKSASVGKTVCLIVMMDLVFSLDSTFSSIAITDVKWVIVTAIMISGVLMILVIDTVSTFLEKNRMYAVLGLFTLLIVGILLLSEGGELAEIKFWGQPVEHMSKATFYFVISILVLVDIMQRHYQKKLLNEKGDASCSLTSPMYDATSSQK